MTRIRLPAVAGMGETTAAYPITYALAGGDQFEIGVTAIAVVRRNTEQYFPR